MATLDKKSFTASPFDRFVATAAFLMLLAGRKAI